MPGCAQIPAPPGTRLLAFPGSFRRKQDACPPSRVPGGPASLSLSLHAPGLLGLGCKCLLHHADRVSPSVNTTQLHLRTHSRTNIAGHLPRQALCSDLYCGEDYSCPAFVPRCRQTLFTPHPCSDEHPLKEPDSPLTVEGPSPKASGLWHQACLSLV